MSSAVTSNKKHYRLFLASPGDVPKERDAVEDVVNAFNLRDRRGIHIDVIRWEDHATPNFGRPQEVIFQNADFQRADIFLAVLWSRMGTPTGKRNPATGEEYVSGTAEEIEQALRLIREEKLELGRFMLYFCTRPVSFDSIEAARQVVDFKRKLTDDRGALAQEYETVDEFKLLFNNHLEDIVQRLRPIGEPEDFEKWTALVHSLEKRRCTAILGPALSDYILGSRGEIAERWAQKHEFPGLPLGQEQLPQVAQYLSTRFGFDFPREKLEEHVRREMRDRHDAVLRHHIRSAIALKDGETSPELLEQAVERRLDTMDLDDLISVVGTDRMKKDPLEPHSILARLPLKIFVTANYCDLMSCALRLAGKHPETEAYRWKDSPEIEWPPSIYDTNPNWSPEVDQPLVYHLFGRLSQPDTVVLSEDDYFDYLIGLHRHRSEFPAAVNGALSRTALLFLGFEMEDWSFRVLFRSLMSQEGSSLLARHPHVAVQIDPREGNAHSPESVRQYLEHYFGNSKISIYWGSVENFLRELEIRWWEEGILHEE